MMKTDKPNKTKLMSLYEIITGFEDVIEVYGPGDHHHSIQMEVILVLAKEIQALKDYVRQNQEDL